MFLSAFAQKTHTVVQGDNAYNISKKYGMTLDELYRLNPSIKDGNVKLGEVLKISANSSVAKTTSGASSRLGKIKLQPKQTLYGITKQYHVTEAEVRNLNPDLKMQIGEDVVLPLDKIQKYGDSEYVATTTTEKVETNVTSATDETTYVVQPKDNYYRIGRKFGLRQKELFALNPGLEEKGLQPGDVIKVKDNAVAATSSTQSTEPTATVVTEKTSIKTLPDPIDDGKYEMYAVQSGDTVFGILNRFGITFDQLLVLNPSLSKGLKTGSVIKIKKIVTSYVKTSGDALNVALLLPFGFDANESKYRKLATEFLSGAKLAAERNALEGRKINLKVIDAGDEITFSNALKKLDKDQTDLIIGPLFKSNVIQVLDYVDEKKIPVVAPFANSEELYKYNNLIIAEAGNSVMHARIAKEIKDVYQDQKIYIVSDNDATDANAIKAEVERTIKNPNVIIVNSADDIQLDQNMMTGQKAPVIAVLATDNEDKGDDFASRMIELSKETQGIKAFSMYYNANFEKKENELAQVSLVYLMDRKIDTEGSFEKEILSAYKAKYCKTPSKYAIIGFDVVNDMLSRENNKAEIFKQINTVQTQLATKFEFVQVKSGGAYVNTGYRVVRLIP